MLGVCAYLVAFPFLQVGAASLALFVLTAVFIALQQKRDGASDPGYAFLWPVLPFLAAAVLAVARAPDPTLASGILSFFAPGLVLFVIMQRYPAWPIQYWRLAWTLVSAVISFSIIVGYARFRLGAVLPPLTGPAEAAVFLAGNELLIVPNDICASAILLVCPLALLAGAAQSSDVRGSGVQPWVVRAAAWATIGLTAMAVVILRSRAGLAVAFTEILITGLVWRRALLWLLPIGLAVAVVDLALGLRTLEKVLLANNLDNHGVIGRLGLWDSAWEMFRTAPFWGHGAQSFGPEHGAFLPRWSPRFPERRVMWAHDLYLETLAEQGLTGFGTLMIMFLLPLRRLCKDIVNGARLAHIDRESVFAVAGLAGFLVAAALELSFIRRWVPLVMFGVIGFALRAHPFRQQAFHKRLGIADVAGAPLSREHS